MSALRELLALFSIEVDPEHNIEKGHHKVESFQKKLEEVAKTVGEAFAVKEVYEFVESQIEAAAHVQDLADRLDVSATSIRNFGFVAKGAGIDLDSAARSLGILEKNLGEAETKGGESAAVFKRLGIALKGAHGEARPLADVLGDAAEGIAKLPNQNLRAAAAMELFGREGKALVPILAKGRDGVAELLAEANELGNGLGDDYFENAKKAREESEKLGFAIQSIKDRAIALVLPAVTWLVDELKDAAKWSLEHAKTTQVLEYAIGGLAIAIGFALTDALVTAAVAAWALVAPFLPIAIAIGALVWIAQDLYKAMTGADSAIADLTEDLGGVGAKSHLVLELNDLWKDTKEVIDNAAFALGYLVGVLEVLGGSTKPLSFVDVLRRELGGLVEDLLTAAKAALALLKTLEAIASFTLSFKKLDEIFGSSSEFQSGGYLNAGKMTTDVTEHGVPKAYVDEWNKHNAPGAGGGGKPEAASEAGALLRRPRPRSDEGVQWPTHPASIPMAPHVGGSTAPAIHLTNHVTQTNILPPGASPKAFGDAAAAGISTATQKDARNTLASVVQK